MTDIFISYAHADRSKVESLAGSLISAGYDVWWDHKLVGGTAFAAEIERALHRSKCVIVVWTIKSVQSEWVLDEAGEAKRGGKLIPIRFDATTPPLGFRQFQTLDFRSWDSAKDGSQIRDLKKSISRFVKQDSIETVAETVPTHVASFGTGYTDAIAVLPLENLIGSAEQQFLVDGIHEALIIELSKIEALRVVSRTSMKRFAASPLSLREIAAELGVTRVVEGSVMRSEGRVMVSAQLIDVRSDTTLWAERFDREEQNILDLQRDVASENRTTHKSHSLLQRTAVVWARRETSIPSPMKNI